MNNCDKFLFYDDLVRANDSTKPHLKPAAKKKNKKKSSRQS